MTQPKHGGNLTWAAELAGCSPSFILDFSASINPLGPPASAIAAIQQALPLLRDYPDPDYRDLRQALSQFHQIPPEWILPGNGSAELLTWACRELAGLAATDLPVPAFGDYLRALNAFNAKITQVSDWFSSLPSSPPFPPSSLPLPNTGLLLNNPHNPTGTLFCRDALRPCLDQYALVVVDEAFMDFLPPDQQQSVMDWVFEYPNLVVLRSLTKFYSLPGLRLGYAIAHPDRLKRWQQWRDPWSVNTLAAAAAIAVLQDTSFQQQTWDWLAAARPALQSGLAAIAGLTPFPSVANYLLVKTTISAVALQRQLLRQHRILIRDCVSFPELGDRFFRVAVRKPEENQALLEGLREVVAIGAEDALL
ncbi:MAG TPA: threonine-phosphate decarboxylase [Synechococcales cyanobacterium M55_K2018_004]|nr:threonine-phosphate decarboxylase [Synechococcales cyanobacterium M55_K2018_004]